MSILSKFEDIISNGKKIWEESTPSVIFSEEDYTVYEGVQSPGYLCNDQHNNTHNDNIDHKQANRLIKGDNLLICKYLIENVYSKRFKLIYADPPFFSKKDYKTELKLSLESGKSIPVVRQRVYNDSWEKGMEEYLTMLSARFYAFKELLSEDGVFWIHLDWHSVHYVKIILDEIFGEKNFVNEVVWNYKSGGVGKRRYSRKHDTLLFYSKSRDYYFKPQQEKSYNRGFKPYRFKGVKEYRDETGWYTLVNMKDVWQLDMVGRTSAERTGYATQKPESLLNRIIESCTKEGDLCADFFGGSGTMAAAAEKANRRWISCDIGRLSTTNTLKRMLGEKASFIYLNTENETENENIDVSITMNKVIASDMYHMEIELKGYKLGSMAYIPVAAKDISFIKEVEKKDWLQLIDFFAVDFDYDMNLFKPQVFTYKNNYNIEPKISRLIKKNSRIAIKVIDIFGNSGIRVI